jgi:hypothetical protein
MLNNPFIIYGYLSPEYFCDRNKEIKRLISAVENNRNITLQSMRRLGKTSLIHHMFYLLKSKRNYRTIYLDLQLTQNLNEFLNSAASALSKSMYSKHIKLFKEFLNIFRSIKPAVTFDAKTGSPSIELGIQSAEQAQITADDIFKYLKEYSRKYKIVVAVDEFQQILNYPEKNMEAILRSKIQDTPLVNFIFSSSTRHLMTEMFLSAKRPFYQSTEMMVLEKLDNKEYSEFIKNKFSEGKKEISLQNIMYILDRCSDYTFYVQVLCNRLYSSDYRRIDRNIIDEVLDNIINEYEQVYYSYKNLLTEYQWKVTHAVALEGNVNNPSSGEFISKYNLHAISSVRTAIKSLLDKEILYRENDYYIVYDVFFRRWLEKL